MKRRLSLLLAVVMILGSFSFAFAAEETAAETAGAFLKKSGILEGINGDLKLKDNLRRQDAVVLVARLHGAEKEAKAYSPEGLTFADFKDPYYRPIIKWAVDEKLVEGHTAERFGFNEDITVQQYATILLRALGYTEEAKDYDKVMDLAKKLELLKDVKAEAKDAVTRGDMAVMTFNALGTKMKGSDKTLADKLDITMPAPAELKAEVKDTENLKEVVVNLSNAKLANKEKLENISNYRLAGNTIERVEVKDNDVLVQVKDALRSGKQYELVIKGVDKAVDGKYKFVARDNSIPAVEKVEVLGEYGIKVVTTEPIDGARSKNFVVDGKNVTMDVEQYGRTIILTPYNGSFSSNAKTLTINELKDFAGFKSAKEDFEIEIVKDEVAPKVEDVLLKGNKVVVVFDKDIYDDSVEAYYNRSNVGNISYELGRHPIYAEKAEKIDVNKVAYTFKDKEIPSRRDKVTIEGVTNHSNVKMEKTSMVVREVYDDAELEIIEKKIDKKFDGDTGTATIKLYFNKDVSGSFVSKDKDERNFVVKDHFTLYEDEVSNRNRVEGKIKSAEYDYDTKEKKVLKDVVVVKLEKLTKYDRLEKDFEYILEIEGFVDASSTRNKMYRDYYEFKFNEVSDFAVTKVEVDKGSKETEITLSFNKYLDRVLAEDATNYAFYTEKDGKKTSRKDVADLDGGVELIGNGTKVLLTIPEKFEDLKDDYAGLRISDTIKDTRGNRLGKVYHYDFASGKLLEEGQTVNEKAVAEVAKLVNALPELDKITNENLKEIKKDVKAIDDAIEKLTAEQKKLISDKTKTKLDDVKGKIKELEDSSQTLAEAEAAVKVALAKFDAKNETKKSDLEAVVEKAITNEKITPIVKEFKLDPTTEEKAGKITVTVELTETKEDGTKLVKDIEYTIEIAKIVPETFEVTLAGDAEQNVDYTISGAKDLKAVRKGTTLIITAVNKIKVGDDEVEAKGTKELTINEATTITINKAQ